MTWVDIDETGWEPEDEEIESHFDDLIGNDDALKEKTLHEYEIAEQSTGSTSWVKIDEWTIRWPDHATNYRLKVELKIDTAGGGNWAGGRIDESGGATGTAQSSMSATYEEVELTLQPTGSGKITIELYQKVNVAPRTAYLRAQRFKSQARYD